MITKALQIIGIVIAIATAAAAGEHGMKDCPMKPGECPMKATHENHSASVDARGDAAMGFSHEKTAHHFLLRRSGGVIQISANEAADSATEHAIREHLSSIYEKFAAGDFDIPMFIHDTVPPGVETMKRLRSQIHYRYEESDHGARINITSENPEAVGAIQKFLRFQIREHRTGDPLSVP